MQLVESSDAVGSATNAPQVFDVDSTTFREYFGRVPFALRHRLVDSGLFTMDRMIDIAEKMIGTGRSARLAMFEGAHSAGDVFSSMKRRPPVAGAVAQLHKLRFWVAFTDIGAVDRELGKFYDETLEDVEKLLGVPIIKDINRGHMNVFMASPHVITPYHLDHEHNFLCQVESEKDVWLWKPDDRATLSELEIERFYNGDMEAARYAADAQRRGHEFHIRPGDALYHPPLAPHWIKNGPEVSLSVSIGFRTNALDRYGRIYQANGVLRKVGLQAPPPGRSPVLDHLRSGAVSGSRRLQRSFKTVQKFVRQSTIKARTAG